jgi:hypothetical protein
MAYDPSNYINGVDQRTVAQQRKDEKADATKKAAKLKEGMRKRILNVKTKSPSATDVQSGKVSGAVKLNKSKTTVKEKTMPAAKKVTPKVTPKPKPKVTKKPEKMTPQDAAMKKILEKKYGKIYG